jgi:hypothetical protein
MCLEGQSFRSVARKLQVNPQTVINYYMQLLLNSSYELFVPLGHLPHYHSFFSPSYDLTRQDKHHLR